MLKEWAFSGTFDHSDDFSASGQWPVRIRFLVDGLEIALIGFRKLILNVAITLRVMSLLEITSILVCKLVLCIR